MKRIILLTGATKGLGRALVDRLIERDCVIWGCGRSADQVKALQERYGPPHDFVVVDTASDSAVHQWIKRLLQFGVPDIVINNAAVINQLAPLWKVPVAEFDTLVDVNIKGVANVLRHVVPAMVERGSGNIINMSSGWGRSTAPEVAPYCASKYAIEGLTKALAEELPDGMAAIPLNPGIVDTDMLRTCFQESAAHYPDAEHWSHGAADYILALGPTDNGLSRTIPQ